MLLHLSVILFTGRSAIHPQADTPLGRHPLGGPPWADTPLADTPQADAPWADTPPGQTSPPADTPLGQTPLLGRHSPAQCMIGYGQQAGGTHPTGMHCCIVHDICQSNFS